LIRKLSKGFRQRVGIAQAIVHDPPAIILDEPTVGLDPRQIIDVRNLIKSLAGDHTIILSTHILPEVSMTCDRVAIINKGRIVATNSPENLMAQLVGGSGYELEVDGDGKELQKLLQILPGICFVEIVPSQELPPNRSLLRIVSAPGAEPGRDIAAVTLGAGLGLHEMRRTRATLEDVFLELTMQETGHGEWGTGNQEPDTETPRQEDVGISSTNPEPSQRSEFSASQSSFSTSRGNA
ncbi:MAG TPA: ABC transporter ATP-binding protein, partial [Cyanophyceae cyanobacterium]